MTTPETETTKSDDSGNYLRVPKPLKPVRGFTPSPETLRRAVPVLGWILAACAAHWAVFSLLLQTQPFLVNQHEASWQLDGLSAVRQDEIHSVFSGDFGRSLVSVDPAERLDRVTSLQWVRSARVARVWPNKIAVSVEERVPIAFLRVAGESGVRMIDADGVILDVRMGGDGSLPVITGIDVEMPIEERLARIRLFEELVSVFSETDRAFGRSVSEVDVSDADNAVVLAMYRDQMVELQMGDRHLKHRLDVFLNYIDAWHSEFGPLATVDLRFEKQVALRPVQPRGGRG